MAAFHVSTRLCRPSSTNLSTRGLTCLVLAYLLLAPDQVPASQSEGVIEAARKDDYPESPLTPAQALNEFRFADDLQIEIVAAEPEVVDPIAIRFDERGRMWVVEMGDYPHGPEEGEPGTCRIKILEDIDRDGRFESATLFADQLLFATGVQPWRNGAFVTMAGKVSFFVDEDDDKVADKETVWFEGFAQENSQLRANHPTLGLDGRIYIANGLRGGAVKDSRRGGEPLSINGMDFAFDPHSGSYAAVAGGGQFGMTFDAAGRRFICSNRNPLIHVVLENEYTVSATGLRIPSIKHDVATSGFDSRVYPISRFWTTSNLHAGQFTAACGATIYLGDLLGESFAGNAFTCEPTGNLVHREVLSRKGATLESRSPYVEQEFLATRDDWFRPVNLECGPDGALYVVDMYRAVIEHPQFVPQELKERPDQRLGDDRGRIYRVVPKTERNLSRRPIEDFDAGDLIGALSSKNGWARETAFRLILQSPDLVHTQQLQELSTKSSFSPTRISALWLLAHRNDIRDSDLESALVDENELVRETGVRIIERLGSPSERLTQSFLQLSQDPSTRVRFQAALSSSQLEMTQDARLELLYQIGIRCGDDIWTRHAILISAAHQRLDLLRIALAHADAIDQSDGRSGVANLPAELLVELAVAASRDSEESYTKTWMQLLESDSKLTPLLRLTIASQLALTSSAWFSRLDSSLSDDAQAVWDRWKDQIKTTSSLETSVLEHRLLAIDLLSRIDSNASTDLIEMAWSQSPVPIRNAAIRAMSRLENETFWKDAIARFQTESPRVRSAILDGLLATIPRTTQLLDAIENGDIASSELDTVRKQRLSRHSSSTIRSRALEVLANTVSSDRQSVYDEFTHALALKGDANRGRSLFAKHCANCHRIDDLGVDVAPDISDSRVKSKAQLLTAILQPNLAIDANYIGYVVETVDGRVLTGVIVDENPSTITLKQAEGKLDVLARSEIELLSSTRKSLMPEGFENDLSVEEMADLISFVKNWRYLDGRVPAASIPSKGNSP